MPEFGTRIAPGSDDTGLWPGHAAWPELLCAMLITNMSRSQWNDRISTDIPYKKNLWL
ncbi:MAG: hypothetical protein WCI74_16215 [Actinomycetes bacterium]